MLITNFRNIFLFAVILILSSTAGTALAQEDVQAKAYHIEKPVLRATDSLNVEFNLAESGFDEAFDPDFVEFGIYANHRENHDYGYEAADLEWLAYEDPNVNYASNDYDIATDAAWLEYQSYMGPLGIKFSQPQPKVKTSGVIRAKYQPPKFMSPFGRSYTVSALGEGRKASGTSIIHDSINRTTSLGHILLFGPEPKGEIETDLTYLPGEALVVNVKEAGKLVKAYGDQCSLNLFHAGRIHLGGAIEGDWIVDRRAIVAGKTRYELDPRSIIRKRLKYEKAYDSYIGPHLVELWCWGVLVDQTEVQVNFPENVSFEFNIAKAPSTPVDNYPAISFAPEGDQAPDIPVNYADISELGEPRTTDADVGTTLSPPTTYNAEAIEPARNFQPFEPVETPDFRPLEVPDFVVTPLEEIPAGPLGGGNPRHSETADLLEGMLKSDYFSGDRAVVEEQIAALRKLAEEQGDEEEFPAREPDLDYGLEGDGPVLQGPDLTHDGTDRWSNPDEVVVADDNPSMSGSDRKLYRVELQIDGLSSAGISALKDDLVLYALPPKPDPHQDRDIKNYAIHHFWDKASPQHGKSKLQFWIRPGLFNIKLGWDGDTGAKRMITLAEKVLTVVAVEDDLSGVENLLRAQGKTPFVYDDISVNSSGALGPYYPETSREFALTSKGDFSNYELFYQVRRKNGFLLGCQPYEWRENEDGDSHFPSAAAYSSINTLYLGRDHPRFGESGLTIASLLNGDGASETIRVNIPKHSGEYKLNVFVGSKSADLNAVDINRELLKVGSYGFTVEHPAADLKLPNGNHFPIDAEEWSLPVHPSIAEGAAEKYELQVFGLDGYLREKRHLDPNRTGRKGLRADYFYIDAASFSPDRQERLGKIVHSASYFNNFDAGTSRTPFWKAIRGDASISIPNIDTFNDIYIVNSLGFELARDRAYWTPWKSVGYLKKSYFSRAYPRALMPFEPDKKGWVIQDDRLRKRAVWDPDQNQCNEPILPIADNGLPGAGDEAIP